LINDVCSIVDHDSCLHQQLHSMHIMAYAQPVHHMLHEAIQADFTCTSLSQVQQMI